MAKGLNSIRMHRADSGVETVVETLSTSAGRSPASTENVDPETAARRYLDAMFGAGGGVETVHNAANDERPAFKYLGIDKIAFAKNQHVKFRQHFHKIPVYGSIVTIELDEANNFISVNSSTGSPANVDPVATVSPADALKKIRRIAGYSDQPLNANAQLHFYYDAKLPRWRLVYIVEEVLRIKPSRKASKEDYAALPESSDFVIDAHSGELVDELPRTQTMADTDGTATANDVLGDEREIGVLRSDVRNDSRMHDRLRNIRTHDFKFRDAFFQQFSLPGSFASNPPDPWDEGAVSAHANATEVIDFLSEVLLRDGLDGHGGDVTSTVNCVFRNIGGGMEWRNAARFRGQMIYGQRRVNGELRSYAASLDVVAHELLHGLTENTARLEYRFESGALNESYSDIYGAIISNRQNADIATWNWEIGEDLTGTGLPLRNIEDPERHGQPAHMDDYQHLEEEEDHGGVHTNSGIHNRAAFNVLTSRDGAGEFLFTSVDVARLYYVALVAHLSRTSDFNDCREAMLLAVRSLFDETSGVDEKHDAIEVAYLAVGIKSAGIV